MKFIRLEMDVIKGFFVRYFFNENYKRESKIKGLFEL